METLFSVEGLSALFTLALLEIVLGVDNLLFLSIQVSKLSGPLQKKAQKIGLLLSALMRVILVFFAGWLMKLDEPFTHVFGIHLSIKGLVLLAGALFLLYHTVHEIHESTSTSQVKKDERKAASSFAAVMLRVTVLGMVFSIDSVVTAIGMTQDISVIVAAIAIAIMVMIFAAPYVSTFIENRPGYKIAGLALLILISVSLGAEAFHHPVPKIAIYTGIALVTLAMWLEDLRERSAEKRQHLAGHVCPMCGEPLNPGRTLQDVLESKDPTLMPVKRIVP